MGIKGISISRGFSREKWEKRERRSDRMHTLRWKRVYPAEEGRMKIPPFSRRVAGAFKFDCRDSARAFRRYRAENRITGRAWDGWSRYSMGHISRTGYTLYLRHRREIALRFIRTRCCNTREIMREMSDVKWTSDRKKYPIEAFKKRRRRRMQQMSNNFDIEIII